MPPMDLIASIEGKIAFLPFLRRLKLCVVFEQALVEIIQVAYGGLHFTMN